METPPFDSEVLEPQIERPKKLTRLQSWYATFERPISSISLVGGFVFDAIFLPRVDELKENLWVAAHIVIVVIAILLLNRNAEKNADRFSRKEPGSFQFWLENVLQFFFGGLLSVYLVFYFRSTTLSVTWPFLAILVIAFIANERLKREQSLMSFQIALLYLSLVSFSIFFTPLIVHSVGLFTFLLSIIGSFVLIVIFLKILRAIAHERYEGEKRMVWFAIFSISTAITVLYVANLIPPIPISLKDAGLYHSIEKADTHYVVQYESEGWKGFFKIYDDFHEVAGEPVYAYSAIFSPGSFNLTVVHEWQYYDEATRTWLSQGSVTLPVIGGRDDGFRTYSIRYGLAPGKWRVNVRLASGAIIGRIYGTIIQATKEPALKTVTKS